VFFGHTTARRRSHFGITPFLGPLQAFHSARTQNSGNFMPAGSALRSRFHLFHVDALILPFFSSASLSPPQIHGKRLPRDSSASPLHDASGYDHQGLFIDRMRSTQSSSFPFPPLTSLRPLRSRAALVLGFFFVVFLGVFGCWETWSR